MGTYDRRGGTAISPDGEDPVIYSEEEQVLSVLESAAVPSEVNDQVAMIIRRLCERQGRVSVTGAVGIEQIAWYPPTRLPDSDLTVQLFDAGSDEPVWPGYYDGEQWLYADGSIAHPTGWAYMPIGPANAAGSSITVGSGDA